VWICLFERILPAMQKNNLPNGVRLLHFLQPSPHLPGPNDKQGLTIRRAVAEHLVEPQHMVGMTMGQPHTSEA